MGEFFPLPVKDTTCTRVTVLEAEVARLREKIRQLRTSRRSAKRKRKWRTSGTLPYTMHAIATFARKACVVCWKDTSEVEDPSL